MVGFLRRVAEVGAEVVFHHNGRPLLVGRGGAIVTLIRAGLNETPLVDDNGEETGSGVVSGAVVLALNFAVVIVDVMIGLIGEESRLFSGFPRPCRKTW